MDMCLGTVILKATEEFDGLESYKRNKYHPKKWKTTACTALSAVDITSSKTEEIIVAPVEENGKDLPSGKNLGGYVDSKRRMDVLQFYQDHKKKFPKLWIIVQQEAAWRIVRLDVSSSLVSLAMFWGLGKLILG